MKRNPHSLVTGSNIQINTVTSLYFELETAPERPPDSRFNSPVKHPGTMISPLVFYESYYFYWKLDINILNGQLEEEERRVTAKHCTT